MQLLSETERPRRTQFQLEQELNELQKKISQGYTDAEIMQDLKLERSMFYRYKKRLYKRSAAIQAKQDESLLMLEKDMLKDRLVRVFRALELRVSDKETQAGDVASCAEIAQEIAINIFKLESEGLRASSGINYLVKETERKGLIEIKQAN